MPQTRERVARDVAARLNKVEVGLDEVISAASELMAAMPAARLEAKVAASVGHDAMAEAAAALAGLISARSNFVAIHDNLATLRDQLGLRVVAGGDLWKLPTTGSIPIVANDRHAA